MNLVLFRLVDMGFNGMFSNPHWRYKKSTCGAGFVLSCLWDGAYKRTLAANQKD